MKRHARFAGALRGAAFVALAAWVAGCAGPEPYVYRRVPGRTAEVRDGIAIAPPAAPPEVHAAIAAGNRIAGLPYARGGGHGNAAAAADAYDCSGSVSYLLNAGGWMSGSMPSHGFRHFGRRGHGEWVSVYARRGHVFAVVAGLRFDTGYGNGRRGPQWTTRTRPAKGYTIRHPEGF